MTIFEKLQKIQLELKAPKNLYNKFGNYKYRSAENILEAFKPLEDKYKVCLMLRDEVVNIADRFYIKAVAELFDIESKTFASLDCVAYAREDLNKKGMDGSQITGSASSYARKYALNGLFLLDDTKDADTEEYQEQQKKAHLTETEVSKLRCVLRNKASQSNEVYNEAAFCENNKIDALEELSRKKFEWILANWAV